jgi:hypothetical protein
MTENRTAVKMVWPLHANGGLNRIARQVVEWNPQGKKEARQTSQHMKGRD